LKKIGVLLENKDFMEKFDELLSKSYSSDGKWCVLIRVDTLAQMMRDEGWTEDEITEYFNEFEDEVDDD